MESVSALVDQIDMLGLIEFVFFRCEEMGSKNDYISLFAFANWLITTLEQSVDFLHRPKSEHPRFQRQIVKRIIEMINALLSALRFRIESSINALSTSIQPSIYPNLHGEDLTDFKIVLAQYDELCLRVTKFILSNATSMATRLTCWRRFSRTLPLKLFSSRSKLKFYSLLLSSISSEIEDTYVSDILSEKKGDISFGLDETVMEEDTNTGPVIVPLRARLIDNGCLAEPFFTVLGQLASLECRPPPLIHEKEQDELCLPNDTPVMEKKLVKRILEILFGVSGKSTIFTKLLCAFFEVMDREIIVKYLLILFNSDIVEYLFLIRKALEYFLFIQDECILPKNPVYYLFQQKNSL